MFVSGPATIHKATLADLLAIPEEQRRHEIVDGVLVEKKAATATHGLAQTQLAGALGPYHRRPGDKWPGGWWFVSEVEVQLAEHQIYRPDLVGWRRERVPQVPSTFPATTPPDWVCEILSTNRSNDLVRKKRGYHRAHVAHYWIVDPREETLTVYRWHPEGYLEVLVAAREERVRAEPFDVVEFLVGILFGDDDEAA